MEFFIPYVEGQIDALGKLSLISGLMVFRTLVKFLTEHFSFLDSLIVVNLYHISGFLEI